MSELIGPAMPGKEKEQAQTGVGSVLRSEESETDLIGPALPPHLLNRGESDVCGPMMPPHLDKKEEDQVEDIGPKLPPHLQKNDENDDESFGPVLPPGFSKIPQERILGPQLPPDFSTQESSDDDDEVIGPLPPSENIAESEKDAIAREFENRLIKMLEAASKNDIDRMSENRKTSSQKMKDKLEGREAPKKIEREKWMTELPPVLQGTLGPGARQFRARAAEVGDRSGWTDTPEDKARKKKNPSAETTKQTVPLHVMERDEHIAKQLDDYQKSDNQESLLSMHEKKRKRKLKEEEASGVANVRRPFDREVDLQVNRFDEAAKKRMLKQSAGLSSRFSHGETSGTFL